MSAGAIHAGLLEILQAVAATCDQRGIEVFLIGGGCLGLVRHGGFVPWDDDLDLAIWAGDIPAFTEAMKQLPGHFAIRAEPNNYDPLFYDPIYKVMDKRTRVSGGWANEGDGIFVDIVPMMHWTGRWAKSIENRFCSWSGFRQGSAREPLRPSPHPRIGRSLARWILRRLLRPLFLRADAECRTNHRGIVTGAFGRRWVGKFEHRTIFPLQRTSFCGVSVLVPNDMHRFLVCRYGEGYMTEHGEGQRWRHFDDATQVVQ